MALSEEIAEARENAAGLDAADVMRNRLGGDIEQGVAGEVAATFRQLLDGVGQQFHGPLEVGQTIGCAHQCNAAPASPGAGDRRKPACLSAMANAFNRMPATRDAVGTINRSSDAISGRS